MSNSFSRMKALLEPLGIVFSENGISNAEIYAYSKGLEALEEKINGAMKKIFFTLYDDGDLRSYAKMLSVNPEYDEIFSRLSHRFAEYTLYEGIAEGEEIGTFSIAHDGALIPSFEDVPFSSIKKLVAFTEGFTLGGFRYFIDGDGMSFDDWDGLDYSFNSLDYINAPFKITDKIRR